MLIPVGTSIQTVKRVPYVTFSLMLINALLCVYTSWRTDAGDIRFLQVKQAIVELSAYYPDVHAQGDAAAVIAEARKVYPGFYEQATHPDDFTLKHLPPVVSFVRKGELSADEAMDRLNARLGEAEQQSFSWKYAFHSYHPTGVSLVSAMFLHGGIFHILGNMWFLYLTGAILEASWGPWLFSAVYVFGGIAALMAQTMAQPNSFVFVLGASGAVAACMGAFLVRFPKVQVKMKWVFLYWFRIVHFDFSVLALYLLPLWLILEITYGFFNTRDVAHWAHVGGFVFGAAAGWLVEKTGLETFVNREEERQTWHPDADVLEAMNLMEGQRFPDAIRVLREYLAKNPKSIDGYETLLRAQQMSEDKDGERETLGILCRLSLEQTSVAEAWKRYEEWLNAGGGPPAPTMWMEFCRYLEREKAYERAVEECERLVQAYPEAPKSFDAELMAARLSLEKLKDLRRAKRWYVAAQRSAFKDLAMDGLIENGLKRCKPKIVAAPVR